MNSDRIREIQETTAYPQSVSVKQALLQVWNECAQEQLRIGENVSQRELLKKFWKYFDEEDVAINCNNEERNEVINDFFNSL